MTWLTSLWLVVPYLSLILSILFHLRISLNPTQVFPSVRIPGIDSSVQTEADDQIPDSVRDQGLNLVVVSVQMNRNRFLHNLGADDQTPY